MIYTCEKCSFTFERKGTVELCPLCEKTDIREATSEETSRYLKSLSESKDAEAVKP